MHPVKFWGTNPQTEAGKTIYLGGGEGGPPGPHGLPMHVLVHICKPVNCTGSTKDISPIISSWNNLTFKHTYEYILHV